MEAEIDFEKFKVNDQGHVLEVILKLPTRLRDVLILVFGISSAFVSWIWLLIILVPLMILTVLLFGKETVRIDSEKVTITTQILLYRRTRFYNRSEIQNFEVADKSRESQNKKLIKRVWELFTMQDGVIQFTYQGKNVKFGTCLEEEEGRYFVRNILSEVDI